jgi:hypothetical protein
MAKALLLFCPPEGSLITQSGLIKSYLPERRKGAFG